MEAKKIGLACFVGGVVCALCALAFTPAYWWLGLIAGFAGGYIAYEFREVLTTIPKAYRAAGTGGGVVGTALGNFFTKKHPFIYLGLMIGIPLGLLNCFGMVSSPRFATFLEIPAIGAVVCIFFLWLLLGFLLCVGFVVIGAENVEKVFLIDCCPSDKQSGIAEYRAEMAEKSLIEIPTTYINVARLMVKGFGWFLWRAIRFFVWDIVCLIGRFLKYIFVLIHSEKRLLCGVDGMLGGAVSYLYLAQGAMSLFQQAMVIFFGGLIGAALGIINWEIVSKRILHVDVSKPALGD